MPRLTNKVNELVIFAKTKTISAKEEALNEAATASVRSALVYFMNNGFLFSSDYSDIASDFIGVDVRDDVLTTKYYHKFAKPAK